MAPPKQKPGLSKQDYSTPCEFIDAVLYKLQIPYFECDLAASEDNTAAQMFYSEKDNSLDPKNSWVFGGHKWCWLNPPFSNIQPWVEKASKEANKGASIAMLVPASVGSNWWCTWVEPYAYQSYLNGRLCFIPNWKELGFKLPPLYPKDCALLLYTPWGFRGHEIWRWMS